jgi:hypothetical protein
LHLLLDNGYPSSLLIQQFDKPTTLLITRRGEVDPLLPHASYVQSYTSYATMADALANGTVSANVEFLLYDNEHWSFTPPDEQSGAFHYAQLAESLAHQHGKRLIFAPAINLTSVLPGGTSASTPASRYIEDDVAGQGARVSDFFEIQAQQTEGNPQAATFAPTAVRQALDARSGADILIGLSTNPTGRAVTEQDLMALYDSTRQSASGYWLNIPETSSYCPRCGAPNAALAISFLQFVAQSTSATR